MFTRLQKLGISLSSSGTLRVIDKLGERHDEEVLKWVENLLPYVPELQVKESKIQYIYRYSPKSFPLPWLIGKDYTSNEASLINL